MEQWAEIRRLHNSEGVPITKISRRLGIARNTVRSALASSEPPKYKRAPKGSLVDSNDQEIRKLPAEYPTMPATVIAERTAQPHSMTVLGGPPASDPQRVPRGRSGRPYRAEARRYDAGRTVVPKTPIPLAAGQSRSHTGVDDDAGDLAVLLRHDDPLTNGRGSAYGVTCRSGCRLTCWCSAGFYAAAFAGTLSSTLVITPPRNRRVQGNG